MSELISGKEAFDAAYNGDAAQWRWTGKDVEWRELKGETAFSINELKGGVCEFRLKPRTITLNGIEVSQPESCDWGFRDPCEVILKFKSREDALHFHNNILKIFSPIK